MCDALFSVFFHFFHLSPERFFHACPIWQVRVYDVLFSPEDPEGAAKEAAAAEGGGADDEDDEGEARGEAGGAAGGGGGEPGWLKLLNPNSLAVERGYVEASLAAAVQGGGAKKGRGGWAPPTFQFQRLGFFCTDVHSTKAAPVFNRVVALKEDKEKRAMLAGA